MLHAASLICRLLKQVSSQGSCIKMMPAGGGLCWQSYNEETPTAGDRHLRLTDYGNRKTSPEIHQTICGFLKNGKDPYLTVMSAGHVLHVFVNGKLAATKLTHSGNVKLRAGINKISLLSVSVGLPNVGVHYDTWNVGVLGPVTLSGLNEGSRDLAKQKWSYKVGLKGDSLSLHTLSGSSSVEWVQGSLVAQKHPLTWYKATFNSPGRFNEKKCQTNCGQPSQRWFKCVMLNVLLCLLLKLLTSWRYAIVQDMTVAGLGLNKFCYARLIAAHKNKEPVTDDIASEIIELVEQSNGWSAVEALSDIPVRSMIGVTEEELYNLPITEYIFRLGGFLNREVIVYHVAFHACADLKNVEVVFLVVGQAAALTWEEFTMTRVKIVNC
ncbi:hypothetical protein FXO37_10794 [Capsicum annuum]|nr:hypothetical protein FXO37_10794 [Capsicum annuum]